MFDFSMAFFCWLKSQYVFAHECIKMAIEKGLHRGTSLIIAEDEQGYLLQSVYSDILIVMMMTMTMIYVR